MHNQASLNKDNQDITSLITRDLEGIEMTYENPPKGVWKRFWHLIKRAGLPWGKIIFTIVISMIATQAYLLFPDYQRKFFDGHLDAKTIGIGIAIIIASAICVTLSGFIFTWTNEGINLSIRKLLWEKIVRLPMSFFNKNNPKELVSRTTSDAQQLANIAVNGLSSLVTSIYSFIITVAVVNTYHHSLTVILIFIVPVMIIVKYLNGRVYFNVVNKRQHRLARITEYLTDILINIPLVKSFARENEESKRGAHGLHQYFLSKFSFIAWNISFIGLDYFIQTILEIICIVYGGYLVYTGQLDLPRWIAFFIYAKNLLFQIKNVAGFWIALKQGQGAVDRISQILEEDIEPTYIRELAAPHGDTIKDHNNTLATYAQHNFSGLDIELKDLSFGYPGKDTLINHLNMTCKYGSLTALVGASGSGKTTILSLIERFYLPQQGGIYLGGININEIDLETYRQLFAWVPQDVRLLSGTLKDNLCYGLDRTVEDGELREMCGWVGLDPLISSHEGGIYLEVGEGGQKLSGGERQKVAIARALLKRPEYLLLDEMTANLDTSSERLVNTSLREVCAHSTMIVVAHRLSTVQDADQIILFDEGKIIDQGKHDELYKRCEKYRKLVDLELSGKGDAHEN